MKEINKIPKEKSEKMESLLKWVWLTTMRRMHSSKITCLLDRFDNIDDIYAAKREDYEELSFLNRAEIDELCSKNTDLAEKVIDRTRNVGGYIITYDSENYPKRLCRLVNPPYVLYVRGNYDFNKPSVNMGVVGTRRFTEYGMIVTSKLCGELARNGFTLISGMARGIDSLSAIAALRSGAETIAVLGCGIDIVYPSENEDLRNHIVEHGAIISEYPPMTEPFSSNFPERNRIIATLSDGLLVTEAPRKSGSLITAKCAHDMGITVFSVPGNIFEPNSVGTNKLIKAGAIPVLNTEDIINEYSSYLADVEKPRPGTNFIGNGLHGAVIRSSKNNDNEKQAAQSEQNRPDKEIDSGKIKEVKALTIDDEQFFGLSADEKEIMQIIIESEKISVDEIIRKSGFNAVKVNSILPLLEIEGYIIKQAGNFYKLAEV